MENADADAGGVRQFLLVNIGDEPAGVTLPAARYGLEAWHFEQTDGDGAFDGSGTHICFPTLPPRTAVVYEMPLRP